MPHYTALVTLLAILFYFYTGARVPRARSKFGLTAPAITGPPEFERIFRVQLNTLEWMPIFLPLMWLFAYYVSDSSRRRSVSSGSRRRARSRSCGSTGLRRPG